MKGFTPENPVVVGDWTSELQADRSEKPLLADILHL
jgi:hypothetical protein